MVCVSKRIAHDDVTDQEQQRDMEGVVVQLWFSRDCRIGERDARGTIVK